jgi:starch-binding outer membrane protein, SusD/RagB family
MPRSFASRGPWLRALASTLVAATAILAACEPNRLLSVNDKDNVTSGSINSKAGLPFLFAGAVQTFQIAYSGAGDESNNGHEGHINMTGIFTDELFDLETFPTRQQVDARNTLPTNVSLKALFSDLAAARAAAEKADAGYAKFDPTNPTWPRSLDYSAYTYLMFAEYYCDGVPFSNLADNGQVVFGVPLTRAQIRAIVVTKFDSALALGAAAVSADSAAGNSIATDSAVIYLARVGKARILVDSGDFADAATIAATVPPGFVYLVENSTNAPVEFNGIWNYNIAGNFFGVADIDGTNGLDFISAGDPRVLTLDTGAPGAINSGPNFVQSLLYPQPSSNSVLASGLEAQLIIAEAQLKGAAPGGVGGWATTLNTLRTNAGMLALTPDSTLTASPDLRVDVMFRERAFWMFLTGHRMEDMRRLVRQYSRAANTVFPIGLTAIGLPIQNDVDFPVSEDEQNNPNFHGCIDRNP